MLVLIDSNIFIGYLKGDDAITHQIREYVQDHTPIFISSISLYEIYLGIVANLYLKEGRPSKVPVPVKVPGLGFHQRGSGKIRWNMCAIARQRDHHTRKRLPDCWHRSRQRDFRRVYPRRARFFPNS